MYDDTLFYDNQQNCYVIGIPGHHDPGRFVKYKSDNGTGNLNEIHYYPMKDGKASILEFKYTEKEQNELDFLGMMRKREDFFKDNGIDDYPGNERKYYTISMTIPEARYQMLLYNIRDYTACTCGDPNCTNTEHPKMLKRK